MDLFLVVGAVLLTLYVLQALRVANKRGDTLVETIVRQVKSLKFW